jgi:hypothetical protein
MYYIRVQRFFKLRNTNLSLAAFWSKGILATIVYQTKGMEDSQPARKNGRSVKKNMNSSNSVM